MTNQFELVNQAFSRQSENYDEYEKNNLILKRMRMAVRNHVSKYLEKGDKILELNAGTGLDAIYFAEKGHTIYATDISDGMIKQLKKKISNMDLKGRVTIHQCSFTNLKEVRNGPFNYIFSNFGGINCISDLKLITKYISQLILPGAYLTWVIMPPVCLWEICHLFIGNTKIAFRRLNRRGILAHIEGVHFKVNYFTPRMVLNAFGHGFKKIKLQGLASLIPPPSFEKFPHKYPITYQVLTWLDDRLSHIYPFNTWADHYILTLRYLPDN